MLKALNNFKLLSMTCETFSPNSLYQQSVRWGRKPLWFPTAKSKLFRVSPRKRLPKEEEVEKRRLYNSYRTQVKSIKQYLEEKYSLENQEAFDEEKHKMEIEEDFIQCSEINDKWNEEIKKSREERVEKELQESIEDAKRRLEKRLKIYAEQRETAEEAVRQVKEASQHFITPDKLDAAIEYAINNPVDYNFALDLDGNKIRGRETKPPSKIEPEKISAKA
ncbi:hypothetical protein ILUMI_24810 [Ignelater luminosus]|uniref:Small ribosomal subunit protein mS26 n=1 Tax=Ignelater luminosus TaxID=2038154 RepID=A0A8K0FYE6_IGNLU|nr:hypothetical protein ILUMI_24810 [Ignelater luminosus]